MLGSFIEGNAQEYTMIVELNNGAKISINTNDIHEITFPEGKIVVSGTRLTETLEHIENELSLIQSTLAVKAVRPIDVSVPTIAWNPDTLYYTCAFNKPLEEDIFLESLEISINPESKNIGDVVKIYIGIIDQRNWFVINKIIEGVVTWKGDDYVIVKTDDKPLIPVGNIIVIESGYQWGLNSIPSVKEAILETYHSFVHIEPSSKMG